MSTPTLIIGLGGAGLQIVRRVYMLATPKQRKNLSFVVFDTDANELRALEEQKMGIHTIQISSTLTVGEYLQQDHNARDHWFPVNRILNSKLMTDGAGQVRAISRLAFNTALVQGKLEPLDEAIGELYRLKGEKLDQSPRIIITGSLCGGTGSGLALPVALYTRNYLETRVQQGGSNVRGFFMLPETFDSVIRGAAERSNLRCNAYAALREIDAFMMKADGYLPPEFDLHFTIPRVNSREEDEYTGRPMEFCFLFDGQNMNGQSMDSREDYLSHAANCIYGMAIAPTSSRSNSSEDNVIRDIMAQKGRNRYAGAGTSMMIYPGEAVKRYLALRWTDDIISRDWVKIDRNYRESVETNRLRRDQGVPELNLNRGIHYIDTIEQEARDKSPFARAIRSQCVVYSDEKKTVEDKTTAELFVKALGNYVTGLLNEERKDYEKNENALNNGLGKDGREDSKVADRLASNYKQLLAWHHITEQCTDKCAQNASFALFRDPSDFTRTNNEAQVEYWIRRENGFIHPSAMRFFIYSAIKLLEEAYNRMNKKFNKATDDVSEQYKVLFDVDNTDVVESSLQEFEGAVKELRKKISGKPVGEVLDLFDKMQSLKSMIDDLWECAAHRTVYDNALKYLRTLSESFETFFDVIERNTVSMHEEIDHLEHSYAVVDGKPIRYVCADMECLRAMSGEVFNKNNSLDLPDELNRRIFRSMRKLALQTMKERELNKDRDNGKITTANRFCISVFDDTIVKYMNEQIEEGYDTRVNMDVLTALEQEAVFRKKGEEMTDEDRRKYITKYMVDAIESTERLASPFISSPRRQPRMITTCTYSPELSEPDIPIVGRIDFVNRHLPNGVVSDDIDPDMILFYQAVYAIEAADLGKFAPPDDNETAEKKAGNYFKCYHDLIGMLHPDTRISRYITPHLDRWWHLVTRTPELSEETQKSEKNRIMCALFWGFLGNFVNYYQDRRSGRCYYRRRTNVRIESDPNTALIVSNGTLCDHLYEVQDAFTVYPLLVRTVLDIVDARKTADCENNHGKLLEDTFLYTRLRDFRLSEFPLPEAAPDQKTGASDPTGAPDPTGASDEKDGLRGVRSIFELPLIVKRSTPARLYNQSDMVILLETILHELYDYHVRLFAKDHADDMADTYDELIMSQFRLMMKNVKAESEQEKNRKKRSLGGDIEEDVLLDTILEYLAAEIEEHGIASHAAEIEECLRIGENE